MRSSNLTSVLKIFFTVFLLYHLAAIVIMPNPSSLLGRKYSRYLTNYSNLLGINTTWQFFSPGPAPVFYLEYDVEPKDPSGEIKTYEIPERRRASYYDELYNRTLYAMRFFVLAPQETFKRFFVPWLCKQHPEAASLSIRTLGEPIENIERASGSETFEDLSEKVPLKQRQRYNCEVEEDQSLDQSGGNE